MIRVLLEEGLFVMGLRADTVSVPYVLHNLQCVDRPSQPFRDLLQALRQPLEQLLREQPDWVVGGFYADASSKNVTPTDRLRDRKLGIICLLHEWGNKRQGRRECLQIDFWKENQIGRLMKPRRLRAGELDRLTAFWQQFLNQNPGFSVAADLEEEAPAISYKIYRDS